MTACSLKWWRLRRRVLQALPEGVRGFVADEDIQLAMQYLVGDAYLNGFTGQWLETAAVRHLLFPLQENTV